MTLLRNSRCRRCYHLTGEVVPLAQPEQENHSGITSAVRLKLMLRGPVVYGLHSTDGVRPESHHSVSLQGAHLAWRHSRTSRRTVRRCYLQRAECLAVVLVCSARTRRLHDEVPSGRPSIDFLDIRILTLLNEQPFHSVYEIAEVLCVSDSTILSHLRE
jgi:hypothetical protein